LYLCGSGASPGGCVSGIPGLRAARAVLRDGIDAGRAERSATRSRMR
jgi:phytoene dehydrogenase-like protein